MHHVARLRSAPYSAPMNCKGCGHEVDHDTADEFFGMHAGCYEADREIREEIDLEEAGEDE